MHFQYIQHLKDLRILNKIVLAILKNQQVKSNICKIK